MVPARYAEAMLRTIRLTLLTIVLALGGGAASVLYALRTPEGVGSVTIAGWTTYPDMGTPEANPYSKARAAFDGQLALGRAEGLAFVAQSDADGKPLRRECRYQVAGNLPPARIWTFYAIDKDLAAISSGTRMGNSLNSQAVLFQPDNSLLLAVSRRPEPGNWLAVSGSGPMSLVLTLYDTPVAGSSIAANIALPRIVAMGCDV